MAEPGIVYVTAWRSRIVDGDLEAVALAADGAYLNGHICSDWGFVQTDMRRPSKLDTYAKHYPDGYSIVFVPVEERDAHVDFQATLARSIFAKDGTFNV